MLTKKKKITSSTGWMVVILLACLTLGDLVLFYSLPLHYLYPFSFDAPSTKPPIAAILFNDFNDTFTGINNETMRRVNYGLALLQSNKVEKLVVVGGNRKESQRKGAQLMADYLLESGAAMEQILLEQTSSDSISNLEQLGRIMEKQGVKTIALISSPYHLQRIRSMKIPSQTKFIYNPYTPDNCSPHLSRGEIWQSAHYNLTAYALHTLLPESVYRNFVRWIRTHTEW